MKIYVYYTTELTDQELEKTHFLLSGVGLTCFTPYTGANPNESDLNTKMKKYQVPGKKMGKFLYILGEEKCFQSN